MGRREQRLRRAARERSDERMRERLRQRGRQEGRVRRRTATAEIKPWHRVIAGIVLIPILVLASLPWTRAEADLVWWLQHLSLVSLWLVLFGGFCGMFLSQRVTRVVVIAIGWLIPVTAVWLAVLMWTDWRQFYSTGARVSIHSEGAARFTAILVVAVAGLAAYGYVQIVTWRGARARR